ncbi:tRNA lysidine(34) synthetase TilS [Tepidimonas charontis]|uniref:tRNA(Ile)-lysidine synthase n=1 Tax=Tepidimonas charontis TaxID=2267262 RepID=A0A554XFD0_9BURK|nr:tRNA lysidine(34) synthetase TilS [Tepidimonas charontis]TSE34530.1 tRNA(Ile)-lysidine synthase [Tepidimonas charontis]
MRLSAAVAAPPWSVDARITAAVAHWWAQHASTVAPTGLDGVGVAFSGGADSTALLLAACAVWPQRVHALHVHHGLQAAADTFAAHAARVCARLAVPLTVLHVQARPAPRQSPEEAARRARYRALAEAARTHRLAAVLLGHHAQDQAETVWLALSRGAGLPGLAGMPALRWHDGVAFGRPLLALDGAALRQALAAAGVPWVEDPSNTSAAYTRNRIRQRLLPAWEATFGPGAWAAVARSARHAAQAQTLLDDLAALDLQHIGEPPSLTALRALSSARAINALRHWLRMRHGASGSDAQWQEVARQITAARTRGHRIELRLGQGTLWRAGDYLHWKPAAVT